MMVLQCCASVSGRTMQEIMDPEITQDEIEPTASETQSSARDPTYAAIGIEYEALQVEGNAEEAWARALDIVRNGTDETPWVVSLR